MKKLLLLVFSMTLVLFFTSNAFAQKGVVKVASNNELIKALDDPTVKTIEITQNGFYDEILLNAVSGTIIVKGESGSRAGCQYWIQPAPICFDTDLYPGPTPGYVVDTAKAGTNGDISCPADNMGTWTVEEKPVGSFVNFLDADTAQTMPFEVSIPGQYKLRYTWTSFTHVQTEYYFYDVPVITLLDADPDTVCGLTTSISFDYDYGYSAPDTLVYWYVNGDDSSAAYPSYPGTFTFTAPSCGYYQLVLEVTDSLMCDPSRDTLDLYFYDTPEAFAGEDDSVCGLVYAPLGGWFPTVMCDGGTTPTDSWSIDTSFTNPGTAVFSAGLDSVTVDICGAYQFVYTVTNGLCVDSDTVALYFYDTPVVDAGTPDTVHVCGLMADLNGTYLTDCDNGVTPSEDWTGPGIFHGDTAVEVTMCGTYTFYYTVVNGLCSATDSIVYMFHDTPVVDAGQDDDVCGLVYNLDPSFTYVCANGATIDSTWSAVDALNPGNATFDVDTVTVDTCGVYTFVYTVTNGPCAATDTVVISFYDTPVLTVSNGDTVCDYTATIGGSFTVDCAIGGTPGVMWTKANGPGHVFFNPDDADTSVVTVDTCGLYTFFYTVTNGPCSAVDSVKVFFAATPEIFMAGVPDKVCGYVSPDFETFFDVKCDELDASAEWTTNADSIVETGKGRYTAYVDTCGVYWFTYTVTNGPCSVDSTIEIEFYETPDPQIVGPDTVYTCSENDYTVTDLGSCNPLDSLEFFWTIAGGVFSNGFNTATGQMVTAEWGSIPGAATIIVHSNVKGLPECGDSDTLEILMIMPTFEGQVKYWNSVETYMPTPYATDDYQTIPFDYFYVTLYRVDMQMPDGLDSLETVYVQPRLMEDLNELMSYFTFGEINTEEYGCDAEYVLKIWDGGMIYHTTPPAPDEETKLGGSTYTYNNWGGVNATDALAIQLMIGGANEINGAPWNYSWVGMTSYTPWYGYYSHGIADVNSSNTYNNGGVTALDALTTKYRAVGLLGSYPHNGAGNNQFSPNFRVTGRMVDSLPQITFPMPFDYPNVPDVPFTHSGADYMYFSYATAHKYTSVLIPWEGDANYINIYYESIGDINASYVPPGSGLKAEPTVELTYEGMIGVHVGEELTIPVSVDRDAEVGAITLSFNYRNDLIEVIGTNYEEDGMFINQEEGILNMAWFSTESVEYVADAAVAEIRIRVLEEIPEGTELFSVNVNTELADATANPIDVDLKSIGVSTDKGINSTELISGNYPNPFKDATTISYTLPESGSVKVDVYNNMGMLVATLVEEVQDSGVQRVIFNTNDTQAGVYFYHITVQGETNTYSAVKRMIVVN